MRTPTRQKTGSAVRKRKRSTATRSKSRLPRRSSRARGQGPRAKKMKSRKAKSSRHKEIEMGIVRFNYVPYEGIAAQGTWAPPVDIYETEAKDLVIKAELPD